MRLSGAKSRERSDSGLRLRLRCEAAIKKPHTFETENNTENITQHI